jgi:RNA-directed DNA polymerase
MTRGTTSFDIHGLPRIVTIHDLAAHSGVSSRHLWYLAFAGHRAYTTFRLAKKTGGARLIDRPTPSLRFVQRWILRNILDRLQTTPSSFGFEKGSKLRFHAEQHAGARAVLTLDIENFFPSISIAQVTQVYRVAGYPSSAASILARLCTCRGALPQGAPTSPRLANLVCFRMDRRLSHFAERRGLVYSRYADDMSFSATSALPLARSRPFVSHIIRDSGFSSPWWKFVF